MRTTIKLVTACGAERFVNAEQSYDYRVPLLRPVTAKFIEPSDLAEQVTVYERRFEYSHTEGDRFAPLRVYREVLPPDPQVVYADLIKENMKLRAKCSKYEELTQKAVEYKRAVESAKP